MAFLRYTIPSYRFIDFISLDCDISGIEYIDAGSQDSPWGGAMIKDSLIVGHSQLRDSYEVKTVDQTNCTKNAIHLPFSARLTVKNVTVVNFDEPWCKVFDTCAHCKADDGGAIVRVEGMTLENSPNRVAFPFVHSTLIYDLDGSLTGHAGGLTMPTSDFLDPNECTQDAAYSFGMVPGSVCKSGRFARIAWNNMEPSSIDEKDAYFDTTHGRDIIKFHMKSKTHPNGWTAFLPIGMMFHFLLITGICGNDIRKFPDWCSFHF